MNNYLKLLSARLHLSSWFLRILCTFMVLFRIGCAVNPYFEADTTSPPARLAMPPVPPGDCTSHCVAILKAKNLASFQDKKGALKKIASSPDLNLHEQLHLVNATLELEMFGMDEVFLELARNRYLRYTTKNYLLNNMGRLSLVNREQVIKELRRNPGVPDELTPMEELCCRSFGLDYHQILNYHYAGYPTEDILIIFFINHYSSKHPRIIAQWRKAGLSWYPIALKLKLDPAFFFVELPLHSEVPEPFRQAYNLYQIDKIRKMDGKRGFDQETILTDEEISSLVQLKLIYLYYNIPVLEIMQQVKSGKDFNEIIKGKKRRVKEDTR